MSPCLYLSTLVGTVLARWGWRMWNHLGAIDRLRVCGPGGAVVKSDDAISERWRALNLELKRALDSDGVLERNRAFSSICSMHRATNIRTD